MNKDKLLFDLISRSPCIRIGGYFESPDDSVPQVSRTQTEDGAMRERRFLGKLIRHVPIKPLFEEIDVWLGSKSIVDRSGLVCQPLFYVCDAP